MHEHITTSILALSATFTLACADADFDPIDEAELAALDDEELELAAPDQLPAAATLAEQIAAHPAYAPLNALAWQRVHEVLLAASSLSLAELDAEAERMNECQQGLDLQLCQNEAYAMGFDPARSGTEAELGQQLEAAFGLNQYPPRQRVQLLRNARAAFVAAGGPEPGPSFVPDDLAGLDCDLTCKQTALADLDGSQAQTIAWFMSSGGGGEGSLGIIWVWDIVEFIDIIIWDCWLMPGFCYEWPDPGTSNECVSDSDCTSTEYCWKGPLGIGENECRPKKQNDEPCSRDAKCLSGCCNFNLFGSKCAEPSKCN